MTYQSLYRRYRPQRFAEVRGQEHLVRALQNAVREDRVGQAYLLSGPRGTGKTSTARILAKVLNCEKPVDGEPCCACEACLAVEQGISFDVHELDAASNNGVDAIRELIAKTALGTPGRTKVYILDEVHMLSGAASNALLKTLEEPPDHVVFVLATTDPQKVLPTIKSRCQHFEVHLLAAAELQDLAEFIVADAGLDVSAEAIDYVVRVGAGSARDMESALDQVAAAGGIPHDIEALDELVEALCERDTGRALIAVEVATGTGRGPRVLGEQLIARLRDVFLDAVGADLSRLNDRDRERVADQARRLGAAGATRALEVLGDAFVGIQDAPDQRIPLEVALVRLTRPDAELNLAALADRVARLERDGVVAQPTTLAATAPATPTAPAPAAPTAAPEPAPQPAADEPAGEPEQLPAAGSRPADVARQALADKKRSSPPARPTPAKKAAKAPEAEQTRPATPSKPADVPHAPVGASSAGSEFPSRDDLTLAWGDHVFPVLPQKVRARFGAGHFVEVADGTAVFGLPNKIHAAKCDEVRAEAEAGLAAYFGRAVPLRIVVDGSAGVPPTDDDAPSSNSPAATPDEDIDLTQLTDATDVAESGVDRVMQMFEGAEIVEEE